MSRDRKFHCELCEQGATWCEVCTFHHDDRLTCKQAATLAGKTFLAVAAPSGTVLAGVALVDDAVTRCTSTGATLLLSCPASELLKLHDIFHGRGKLDSAKLLMDHAASILNELLERELLPRQQVQLLMDILSESLKRCNEPVKRSRPSLGVYDVLACNSIRAEFERQNAAEQAKALLPGEALVDYMGCPHCGKHHLRLKVESLPAGSSALYRGYCPEFPGCEVFVGIL